MFHVRKVPEEKRHPELRNYSACILLELICVNLIVLRGEDLHRDGNLIDIASREERRVANGDAVDQWWLVLACSKAERGPPAITESNRADEGVCEVKPGLAIGCKIRPQRKGGEIILCERIVHFFAVSRCRHRSA